MPDEDPYAVDRPGETPIERADRNFGDLLQELRVVQTGIQILFAGLLAIPFQQRFTALSDGDRRLYVVALLATALAAACVIAPVSIHRLLFRRRRKPELVVVASHLATAGLALLGFAIVTALTLVLDVLLSTTLAVTFAAVVAVAVVGLWVVLPVMIRTRE